MLTVVEPYDLSGPKYFTKWICRCECGNEKILSYSNIVYGLTKSCGCKTNKYRNPDHLLLHGLSNTKLYRVHCGMIARCYDPKAINYHNYGGRGIYICDEWYTPGVKGNPGFMNFYNWSMANGYHEGLSIDRKDNDGPYAPWNCRWTTKVTQGNNTRKVKYICDGEETLTYSEFARKYNVHIDFVTTHRHSNWPLNAIVHKARHPELKLHRGYRSDTYYDKDNYQVLIPRYNK